MAYRTSSRTSSPVRWVVIHTAEGSRTKESLANYFRSGVAASSHVGIDGYGIMNYVPYDRAAWTLRRGNPVSDNAELCGFARWSRDQWFSTGTVDGVVNPFSMVNHAVSWVRSRCIARLIPIRKLSPAEVRAGQAGVIGHYDYTIGMKDGTHTDPGKNFPWDYVITKAYGGEVSNSEVTEIRRMMWAGGPVAGAVAPGTLIDVAREIRSMLWAGGNVEGSVVDGTLISDVREMKAQLATIMAKLDSLTAE